MIADFNPLSLESREPFGNRDPERPLVSVQLMCHDDYRDVVGRALLSVAAQTLPHDQLEVQIVWDGPPADDIVDQISELTRELDFPASLVYLPEKDGYYCNPRNNGFHELRGFYVAHLDGDNEWRPQHLAELVRAMRTPDGPLGFPHFAYSRREYVQDNPDETLPEGAPVGPSPFIPWASQTVRQMLTGPQFSFIDTGDLLISKSVLFWLHLHYGCVWNPQVRRFADWDLVCRMIQLGLRGKALEELSHVYHWTGKNVQLTRPYGDIDIINVPTERLNEFA